jgi:hypothetical protein
MLTVPSAFAEPRQAPRRADGSDRPRSTFDGGVDDGSRFAAVRLRSAGVAVTASVCSVVVARAAAYFNTGVSRVPFPDPDS